WFANFPPDLADREVFQVDADISVDAACDFLVENNIPCLAVRAPSSQKQAHIGLFDCADVNAFLTLAATSHLLSEDDPDERVTQILEAARNGTGKVPVQLCTDLSEKNPLVTLPPTATILSLLEVFSRGTHRVIIEDTDSNAGMVSDIGLLDWFMTHASTNPALTSTLAMSLSALGIRSQNVISCISSETVLDAMKLMSEQGLSSLAVTDAESGDLLSAVSVTDVARLVAPSQSKKILSMPLGQFIALIKAPGGSQDGVDRYPVFSVSSNATLSLVMQKLLATNTHRVFITDDPSEPSTLLQGNLRGVVSVVDVLSVFAHLAGIPDIDPTRMQRHRRASSASSSSSR
ncbi:CBS-domain-containing protein, partial [Ramaria rubella]